MNARFPGWILWGAVLLGCIYLPTLSSPFDFIDDGNLVYPAPPVPFAQRLTLGWQKVLDNFDHLGPFRPVLWLHWETLADLLGADAFSWRVARLLWAMLSAGMMLWLLRELRIPPRAALVTTALALANRERSEIWTSLTLSEGVAMPYALGALVCAMRATRSLRPWRWDVAGVMCMLAALGCKNTFAAVVPAQMLLRMLGGGLPLRDGWRRHGTRAVLLSLALLLPVGHYVIFRLTWHPGQYPPAQLSSRQLRGMLSLVWSAANGMFLLPVGILLLVSRPRIAWEQYRVTILAGMSLFVLGLVVYLPIHGISGRYSMPAVWGLDLLIAVMLAELTATPWVLARRVSWAIVAVGLFCAVVSNVGRQERFTARARMLWQAAEHLEGYTDGPTTVGWRSGPCLNAEEGIHFAWHLEHRGRSAVQVQLLDAAGNPLPRRELPDIIEAPQFLISESAEGPCGWQLDHTFAVSYWFGCRTHQCHLFRQAETHARPR